MDNSSSPDQQLQLHDTGNDDNNEINMQITGVEDNHNNLIDSQDNMTMKHDHIKLHLTGLVMASG